MKKLIAAAMVIAVLAATGCAASSGQDSEASGSSQAASSAESAASDEAASSAEAAVYEISVAVPEGQSGEWRTDDPETQENNIVKLVSAQMEEGAFVARYEAVNDGTTSVNLKHYDGVACDAFYTYTLAVEGGQISEEGAPEETKAPDADVLDTFLSGEWAEDGSQFATMTVKAGEEGGWDAEVATPATHSAHVYKMTLHYDCFLQKLVYDGGSVYDAPITDSDEGELGDPVATDQQGIIEILSTDDGKVGLYWNSEANSEGRDITFARTDGGESDYADFQASVIGADGELDAEDASDRGAADDDDAAAVGDGQNPVMNFVGPYAAGRASMTVDATGESGASITIIWGTSAAEHSEWVIEGTFDPDTLTVEYSGAVKTNYVFNEDGTVKSQDVEYSDGTGSIVFNDSELSCTWFNDNEPDNGSIEFTWSA